MKKGKKLHKVLFIEGAVDENVASLRQGFTKLFQKELAGNMPRIIMGDGIYSTIDKFKNNDRSVYSFLLVDSDCRAEEIDDKIRELNLKNQQGNVFFMIQELEAWFLSQPEIVDMLYGNGTTKRLEKKPAREFPKPSHTLALLTSKSLKGKYHKVKHAVELLELLDTAKLKQDFPEFRELVHKISQV